MAGVAALALARREIFDARAVRDAAEQHVAAGIFVVDIDLRGVASGVVGHGDGVVARRDGEQVVVHRQGLGKRGVGRHGRRQLLGLFGHGLRAELECLQRLSGRERADVEFIALVAAREGDVRILHIAAAGVFHADAKNVRHRLIRAVLDEQPRVAPGADELQVVADVRAVKLGFFRCEAVFVGLGGFLAAARAREQQRRGEREQQHARAGFHEMHSGRSFAARRVGRGVRDSEKMPCPIGQGISCVRLR